MLHGSVTTPFGQRPAHLRLVKRQIDAASTEAGQSIDKWKLFRNTCGARSLLGVQDRALAVLNALLTFHPHTNLCAENSLIVFPSNNQLSLRSNGISGATLRRALAALVDVGLIERHDSPNGKRYAHKDKTGQVEQAYGFSLEPLLSRADEIARLADEVAEEARLLKRRKEELTVCRRDVRKLIAAATEDCIPGDWSAIEAMYTSLIARLPRNANRLEITHILEELVMLREEIINLLEIQLKTENMNGNGAQFERHIQNSNTESTSEFELGSEEAPEEKSAPKINYTAPTMKAFPLGMVMQCCPDIISYGPDGQITSWRDLMKAATVVRAMLGVSPSAYEDACAVMGAENASVVIACILERAGHISSAGGYLRNLTVKAERGEFSLGPVLMALLRANGQRLQPSAIN